MYLFSCPSAIVQCTTNCRDVNVNTSKLVQLILQLVKVHIGCALNEAFQKLHKLSSLHTNQCCYALQDPGNLKLVVVL